MGDDEQDNDRGETVHRMVDRVLFIADRRSGIAAADVRSDELALLLHSRLPTAELTVRTVENHSQVGSVCGEFLGALAGPAAILVGGGGRTLRAVVETLFAVDERVREFVRIGPLRAGSGSALARHLGVPSNLRQALADFVEALAAGRQVRACAVACSVSGDGTPRTARRHVAVTLGGFGQFGQLAADLARSQWRWPRTHRLWARLLGVERLARFESYGALLRRAIAGALFPSRFEDLEICQGRRGERFRLLSGALLNFPFPALPFKTALRLEEPEVELHAVPYFGRRQALKLFFKPEEAVHGVRVFRIAQGMPLTMRLLDRAVTGFSLDDGPEAWSGTLELRIAGCVTFLPGRPYGAK